jgi:radical SAM-linked protein
MRRPGGLEPPDDRPSNEDSGRRREGSRVAGAPDEPRQRWRVVTRRAEEPGNSRRDDAEAWAGALLASGLPVSMTGQAGNRPRLLVGAALPAGMSGERELLDIFLSRRLPMHVVRESLESHLPPGHALVDLYDVWLGAPPLPAIVVAADYAVSLGAEGPAPRDLAGAAAQLLGAPSLPRQRAKGGGMVAYDLRPLLADIRVERVGHPTVLRIRTRFHPQLGTGRPAEVLEALGEILGQPIPVAAIVRERLVLAGEA